MTIIETVIEAMKGKWHYYNSNPKTQSEYMNYILVDSDEYSLSSVRVYHVSVKSFYGVLENDRYQGSYINVDLDDLLEFKPLYDGDEKDNLTAAYAKRILQEI